MQPNVYPQKNILKMCPSRFGDCSWFMKVSNHMGSIPHSNLYLPRQCSSSWSELKFPNDTHTKSTQKKRTKFAELKAYIKFDTDSYTQIQSSCNITNLLMYLWHSTSFAQASTSNDLKTIFHDHFWSRLVLHAEQDCHRCSNSPKRWLRILEDFEEKRKIIQNWGFSGPS